MGLKFRKCLAIVLAFGIMTIGLPGIAASSEDEIQVSITETQVTVKGTLQSSAEELITLAVYKAETIERINRDNTCFLGQASSDASGSYSFSFDLAETDASGYYWFYVQSRSMQTPLVQQQLYVTEADTDQAFSLIQNAADAAVLAKAWQADADLCLAMQAQGLLAEDLSLLTAEEYEQVAQAVLDGDRENWEQIGVSFNTALAMLRVNAVEENELQETLIVQFQGRLVS